ncbi:hypothetical protein [Pararhizobium sp. A13]|uniref:hypothetical protein n=1 Tax=Pararhizobium sp. A13 TaxID=3133975 RepID=UPI00311B0392
MLADTTPHEYYWMPMYFSPDHDFVGYEGQRMIGRVTLEGRMETEGAWRWSNIGGTETSQLGVQQGYASSKELAVTAVETCDREMMAGRHGG